MHVSGHHQRDLEGDGVIEVLKIQTEGRQKRTAAEVELRKLEAELREKLLEVKKLN